MTILKKYNALLFTMAFIFYACGSQKNIKKEYEIYEVINEFLAIGKLKTTPGIYKYSTNYNKKNKNWSSYLSDKSITCHVNYELYTKITQDYRKEINNPDLTSDQIADIEKKYKDKIFLKLNTLLTPEDITHMKTQNKNDLLKWDKRKLNKKVRLTKNPSDGYTLSIPYFSKNGDKAMLIKSGENEDIVFFFVKKAGKWTYFCHSEIRIIFVD